MNIAVVGLFKFRAPSQLSLCKPFLRTRSGHFLRRSRSFANHSKALRPVPARLSSNHTHKQLSENSGKKMATEFVECVVAKTTDMREGEMREVAVGESGHALLVLQNGQFSALGNKCTHYGAPLVKGCLGEGRVRCPWHGACFNVGTGDIEDFPGLDSLSRYEVRVEGEDVIIKADKQALQKGRRTGLENAGPIERGDTRVFLIVGGGPATVEAAETLRREGFKGRIVIISRESDLPYDRPKLSKAMNLTAKSLILRPISFYEDNKIELQLGKEVTSVVPVEKRVVIQDGTSVSYDTLLLATGARPRTLPIPGFEKKGVFMLREPSQANAIAKEAEGKRVVIIGTSFIGMEVGAYLLDKAASVDCIGIAAVPFERVLGERIGKTLQKMFEEKGVTFHLNAGVKEIMGQWKVTGVKLPSDEVLPADLCIFGVGVVPATDFLKSSGLPMSKRGEIIVDQHMKVAESDSVYAAGDIAQFTLPLTGDRVSIGHWQLAHYMGRLAAQNMMGKEQPFNSIPFFWTVLFGKSLRYCGLALSWDEIIFHGSPEELKFAAYFVKEDQVLAAASLNADPAVATAAELFYQKKMPTATQLKANPDITAHL